MISRGEVRWASLDEPTDSGPGKRRPVLIVSADSYNRSAINTVIVVAITSNEALGDAPGNVVLSSERSGLAKVSVANVSAVVTLDKSRLGDPTGSLDVATMSMVDDGLRQVFELA